MNNFESDYRFGNFLEDSNFDPLIEYLQSHYQKKDIVNDMAKGNIPMHALIFLCGWDKKSLQIIFSCIFTSLSNVMICGNNLAHWIFNISNGIYGGVPTTIDDIKRTWFGEFVCQISVCPQNRNHKKQFKWILAASVLRFHEEFLGIIANGTPGKYKYPTHPLLHQKIFPF